MAGLHGWTVGSSLAAFAAVTLVGGAAQAHFVLQAPAAMTEQNDLGDPQKTEPCGGDPGVPTGQVTTYQAGETITITIDETIFHPGHYRVALAVNDPSELPPDPPVMAGGGDPCASTVIQDPAVFPILADAQLEHTARFDEPQSFQVTLPSDVECSNCTLQIIQYMSSHAAPCFYHHCATIAIQADPVPGTGDGGSTSGPSTTSTTAGTSAGSSAGTSTTTGNASAGGSSGDSGSAGADAGEDGGDDGGCSVSGSSNPGVMATLLGLGLFGLRLRRR